MRLDYLLEDTKYFAEHFPDENYDMLSIGSWNQQPQRLESYLSDGWNKGTDIKLSFFEALAWVRYDDVCEYIGFRAFSINEYDREYTYDDVKYQDWACDEQGNFDITRYASAIYNIPIRIVHVISTQSTNKQDQARKVIEYIEKLTNS
jgi:hypothetical protein